MSLKRGQIREDGMVYMGLMRGKPYWASQQVYDNVLESVSRCKERKREEFERLPRTLKRGDVRSDGKVFLQYSISCRDFERWITPEQMEAKRKSMKRYNDMCVQNQEERIPKG